ncbi:hypothetical protein F5Y18DRAFT_367260 [Xylariaceae sp. FL1019]|nr:hypothetical protein F5Y18DRAFT_367260 [Xylariaceae sp. FL1019]
MWTGLDCALLDLSVTLSSVTAMIWWCVSATRAHSNSRARLNAKLRKAVCVFVHAVAPISLRGLGLHEAHETAN